MVNLNLTCTRQLVLSLAPSSLNLNHRLGIVALNRFNFGRSRSKYSTTNSPSPPSETSGSKKLLSSIVAEPEPLDPPIKFSTSLASQWKAHDTHTNINSEAHPYTAIIFSVSTAVLLLYFCVFREENDIDEEMKKSLWERIPGLERQQLKVVLEYNKQVGMPTADIRKRMAELDGKEFKP